MPGHDPWRMQLSLDGGEVRTIEVTLSPRAETDPQRIEIVQVSRASDASEEVLRAGPTVAFGPAPDIFAPR